MSATPTATRVAGGLTVELPQPVELAPEAGALLLRLARGVISATISGSCGGAPLSSLLPSRPPQCLLAPAAAFVTLHEGGRLRGCIGSLAAQTPLWMTVVSAAIGAATRDPRFPPVEVEEVPALSIEVSVLGPPIPLVDATAFRPGVDGLIVERDGQRGLLLPEVATESGWGVSEMLDATCWKAGLAGNAWRDPATQILVFRSARVSESERAR